MTVRVLAVGNNNTTQEDHRSLISALTTQAGSVAQRPGVFPSNNRPAALTNVSSMVVGVGGFRALVKNDLGAGYFLVQSNATENLTFDPGEAGVARTDRIIIRVYNDANDGSGRNEAVVEYLKGQSSGSATSLPSNSLLLWEVPVPAGASSGTGGINFTATAVDKRLYTVASGGIVAQDYDTADLAFPYDGQPLFDTTLDILYFYDGSNWRPRTQITVASYSNLSSIKNVYDGLMAYVRDVDIIYVYNGTTWQIKGNVTAASLSALQALQGVPTGTLGITSDTRYKYIYNGTAWIREPIIKTGTKSCSISGNTSLTTVNYGITFPGNPQVFTNITAAPGGTSPLVSKAINADTNSFQIFLAMANLGSYTGTLQVDWMAIYY